MGNVYEKITVEGEDKTLIRSSIVIYDKNSLEVSKKYLQSGNIDIKKLNSQNGVILINKTVVYNENTKKNYFGPVADIKVGDEIELHFNKNGRDVIIEDTGEGISENDLPNIFNRFYKAKASKKSESIGIGLALSKSIVEAHNGVIEVRSVMGVGTKFIITFIT